MYDNSDKKLGSSCRIMAVFKNKQRVKLRILAQQQQKYNISLINQRLKLVNMLLAFSIEEKKIDYLSV